MRKPEGFSPLLSPLKWSLAILGWIGMACTLVIGAFIITWSIQHLNLGSQFFWAAIVVWVLTVVSAFFLGYGSLKVARGFMLRGGALNSIAGCAMFAVFYYFYYYFPLLPQFELFGLSYAPILFAPALVSGLLSLAWHQKALFQRRAVKKARRARKPYPSRKRAKTDA